ncbi:MAG: FAD-dependent oxidoreductase [Acidimicrobiaceae bacterium]|nr:FAD-dependent oxidoreductase [Acidimicrobiaceae bacterium]
MNVVIIGGVAGGMSVATRLRRLIEDASIVVIERSAHVSYANCGLPYYVGGVIEDEAALLLQTPESLHERFRIDVRVHSEALSIDAKARRVRVRNLDSDEEYELAYDALVLSPGASPVVPPIPGIERAYPLRTVEDVERLTSVVQDAPRHAVVIGGGFIGLEIAENLVHRGIATRIVEASTQLLAPLDPEMAALVAEEVVRQGVELHLGTSVSTIGPTSVHLSSGEVIDADLVVLAIGVRPDTALAREAGLDIGSRGGIAVNGFNQTSDPTIYALGDAAEKMDALDGSATLVPLANIANRHGRLVADHIAGVPVRPRTTIGTAIVKVFDLTVATTGWNEKRLATAGRSAIAIHTHPSSHAGYYPGARPMSLKILVDPTSGALLGAQGVGTEGVDKRIDVLATAIRGGIGAAELADLELAYAPPFGSAKDPVNMLGYVAGNVLSGLERTAQWHEVEELRSRGVTILDVRSRGEFERGSLPDAVNIPVDELRERRDEIAQGPVMVFCQVGQRGHVATQILNQWGLDVRNLDGGYATWSHSPAFSPTLETLSH